jgi:hypothetical protein
MQVDTWLTGKGCGPSGPRGVKEKVAGWVGFRGRIGFRPMSIIEKSLKFPNLFINNKPL